MTDQHSYHQTDLPINLQILNISVNMSRISKWLFEDRIDLTNRFIEQTESYLNDLKVSPIQKRFKPTLERFSKDFFTLKKEQINDDNKRYWVERSLTWANILQHRAKLA